MDETLADLEPGIEEKPTLQPKVYEAVLSKYDGEAERRYYQAERLVEAAQEANSVVENDPFLTLVQVRELGPLN